RQAKSDYDLAKKRADERILQVKAEILQKVKQKQEADLDTSMASLQTEIVPLEKFVAETRDRADVLAKDLDRINISSKRYDVLDSEIQQEQKNVDRLFDVFKQAQMEEEAEARVTPIGEAELQNRDVRK